MPPRPRSTCAARSRPDSSSPMRAPTSRAARRCCGAARRSPRARSACWRPAGSPQVDVVRRPKVAVLSTGDELTAPGTPLRPGAVYDSTARSSRRRSRGGRRAGRVRRISGRRGGARSRRARRARGIATWWCSPAAPRRARAISRTASCRGSAQPGVIVHGVALKPGKPLCLAVAAGQAHRRAAGLSDLGDLHLPCLRGAGDPRQGGPAAGSRREGRRGGAGAHPLRARPQGVRAGRAGRGRGRPDRVSDRQGLRLGHDLLAGRRLPRSRCAAHRGRSGHARQGDAASGRRARPTW